MSVPAATATMDRLAAHLHRRARWRWPELIFWLGVLAVIFALPSRAAIINEALIAGLFALSLTLFSDWPESFRLDTRRSLALAPPRRPFSQATASPTPSSGSRLARASLPSSASSLRRSCFEAAT
jgi:hypothetical protein